MCGEATRGRGQPHLEEPLAYFQNWATSVPAQLTALGLLFTRHAKKLALGALVGIATRIFRLWIVRIRVAMEFMSPRAASLSTRVALRLLPGSSARQTNQAHIKMFLTSPRFNGTIPSLLGVIFPLLSTLMPLYSFQQWAAATFVHLQRPRTESRAGTLGAGIRMTEANL